MRERFHRPTDRFHPRRTDSRRPTFDPPAPKQDSQDGTIKTGTTTIGLKTDDGVVLATDMRASVGGQFITNKNVQKVEQIHPRAAITLVGSVGEAQWFIEMLRSEANVYELEDGEPLDVEALQQLAGTLAQKSPIHSTMPILGGVDESGHHVASIDPTGGVITDDYIATGSGMQVAYGCLEEHYEEGLSNEAAAEVAAKTVRSASNRDTSSGNGIYLAEITDDGVDIHGHKDFDDLL